MFGKKTSFLHGFFWCLDSYEIWLLSVKVVYGIYKLVELELPLLTSKLTFWCGTLKTLQNVSDALIYVTSYENTVARKQDQCHDLPDGLDSVAWIPWTLQQGSQVFPKTVATVTISELSASLGRILAFEY